MEDYKNRPKKEPSVNDPNITRENYERIKALRGESTRKKSGKNSGTSRTTSSGKTHSTDSGVKSLKDSDLAAKRASIAKKNSATATNSKRLEELRGNQKNNNQKSSSKTSRKASGRGSSSNAKKGRTVQPKALPPLPGQEAPASARRTKRQEKRRKQILMIASLFLLAIVFFVGVNGIRRHMLAESTKRAELARKEKEEKEELARKEEAEKEELARREEAKKEALEKVDYMVLGYDYDGAIDTLKSIDGYESDQEIMEKIQGWEAEKEKLVGFSASEVTHIFYHTLVVDPDLAFGDVPGISNGFKQWMTTVDEFNRITQKMYDDGYVLVGLYDLFDETTDEKGNVTFTEKKVYLPKGKKPFILSLDDLSYYHTYTDHGMATKLIIGDDGKVTCEYKKKDGSIVTGSYDCVPLIDDFMTEHPDGAYHGARGTIALTGYNGVFGYRTDMSYVTKKNLDEDKVQWLKDNPDFDHDKEVEGATKIAEALKAEGWTFASHTWGHLRVGRITLDKLKEDTKKWLDNVLPIIGPTDCIIFAHGQDMSENGIYSTDNKKYAYLKSKGFHVFLNVDSHKYTMEIHEKYVHGGRRNLDGYRLWKDAHGASDWTSDLFDAADILDSCRTDMPEVTD